MAAAWERAAERTGIAETGYSIGGCLVLIRCAGSVTAGALTRALTHLQIDTSECSEARADLIVDAFESSSPPISLTPTQWVRASLLHKPEVTSTMDLCLHYSDWDGRLSLLSRTEGRAIVGIRDVRCIPAWYRATPLRDVFNAWFQFRDGQLLHGALVGDDRSAVLLTGRSGSGKSSSALQCLQHDELMYLGDDLCLVRRESSNLVGYSLYNSAKVLSHDLTHFAEVVPPNPDDCIVSEEKRTYFLDPAYREKIASQRQLRAIFLPVVASAANSRLIRASSAAAWKAIVPNTIPLTPGDHRATLEWSSRFVKSLPVYRLELGSDRSEIPALIHRFLSEESSWELRRSA